MTGGDPSWELYRSFLAVLAEGSLSAAARRLSLSQPTVGRHIEALEQGLGGLVLFTRSQQGFSPTDAALELEPHVRVMASASEAVVRTASGEAGEARGVVRITASEIVGAEVLPPLLRDFREAHPGVVVEVALANRTEDLLRREADIAVRMVQPTQGALLSQKIGSVRLGFYAHRRYVERHGMPTTIPELLKRPLIGFDRRPTVSPSALSGKIEVTRDLFAFRADNDLACLAALRAGFGIGVCQELLAARDPDLLPFGHDVLDINLPIWLVMHEDLKGVRRMRLMFDHLVQGLRAYLAGEPI
jgi:DNA-binding transcriptional LysR family regulator